MGGNGASSKKKGGGGAPTGSSIRDNLRNVNNINEGVKKITPVLNQAPVGTKMEFSAYGGAKTIFEKESPQKWKKTWYNAGKNQWSVSQNTKVTAGDIFNAVKS